MACFRGIPWYFWKKKRKRRKTGSGSECHKECSGGGGVWHFLRPRSVNAKKHSSQHFVEHSEPGAQKLWKNSLVGHFLTGGGERNGGHATFVWQERVHTCATQTTHMPSLKPLSLLCQNQGSLRHRRVNCHRKNLRPIFGNGPNTVSESTVSHTELSEFLLPSPSSGQRT